jgi:DNA topoisomerase I
MLRDEKHRQDICEHQFNNSSIEKKSIDTMASTDTNGNAKLASQAGLIYVDDFKTGVTRRKRGKGFTYIWPNGQTIKDEQVRQRIQSLTIPPAWSDVWICPKETGHIQARGVDDAGRIQTIYHDDWNQVRNETKYDRMERFAELLPKVRRRIRKDLNGKSITRTSVTAALVRMIDRAKIRVGNEDSVKNGEARGATTLSKKHVEVKGAVVTLNFPGKSGQSHEINFTDQKVASVIAKCARTSGRFLFGFSNGKSRKQRVRSSDVNNYLQEISGESITAKDFRTWWGNVITLNQLDRILKENDHDPESQTERKELIGKAVNVTANALGNTPAVCRESYIHPGLIRLFEKGELKQLIQKGRRSKRSIREMTKKEMLLVKLLPHLELK